MSAPDEIERMRKRRAPKLPAAVVIVTLDTSGRPFTPQTAGAYADVLNHATAPGVQVCRVYVESPLDCGVST